ncbi:MAG: hypothetical protein ACM335_03875 [Deltaproteobacteria bacterium]
MKQLFAPSAESGTGAAWMVCSAVLCGGMDIWLTLGVSAVP